MGIVYSTLGIKLRLCTLMSGDIMNKVFLPMPTLCWKDVSNWGQKKFTYIYFIKGLNRIESMFQSDPWDFIAISKHFLTLTFIFGLRLRL